jgi:hypothetical protein
MRFVVGKEDEHEEHDKNGEHDTQIYGQTHTHKNHMEETPRVEFLVRD